MGGALLVAFSAFWHPAAGFYFLLGGFENRNPELHAMLHATVTVAPYAEVARAPEREANTPQKMWAETQELGSRYHARFAYNTLSESGRCLEMVISLRYESLWEIQHCRRSGAGGRHKALHGDLVGDARPLRRVVGRQHVAS